MLDHMLFDMKKWYEGEKKPYIGKFVYTSKNVPSYNFNQGAVEFQNIGNWRKETINGLRIIGEAFSAGTEYTSEGSDYILVGDFQKCYWIKASDVTIKTGGVISLLSHIRRCLQSLLRNEVVA